MLAGYAYGVATNYYPFPFTAMSVYGAASAFLLAVGLLAASPEYGLAAAIVERSPAGEMLRRLLPGILVLPLVIGWFARQAEAQSFYDSAATLAIFAVASIIVLAVFAWTTIGAVRRADEDRNEVLMELRGQREWLSTTLGSIGDGVIATDPNGSVLLLNKVAEQIDRLDGGRGARASHLGSVPGHRRGHAEIRRRSGAEGAARARGDAPGIRRAARHPRRQGTAGRAFRRAHRRL